MAKIRTAILCLGLCVFAVLPILLFAAIWFLCEPKGEQVYLFIALCAFPGVPLQVFCVNVSIPGFVNTLDLSPDRP